MGSPERQGWADFFPVGDGARILSAMYPPVVHGVMRATAADFVVDEILTPDRTMADPGRCEHLWLCVDKQHTNTAWVVARLADHFRIRRRDVGFSGHKDRHARTRQWFSVWLPGLNAANHGELPDLSGLGALENVRIAEACWQPRKIRRGTHRQNRFSVRLRGLEGSVRELEKRLRRIALEGVPNLFGPQRFGHETIRDWQAPSLTWSSDRDRRGWQISAVRSALFNHQLARRMADGTWAQPVPEEDWLQWQGSAAGFALESLDQRLHDKLQSGELSPTCWLPGLAVRSGEGPLASEEILLKPWQPWVDGLAERRVRGLRRSCRLFPGALEWKAGERTLDLGFRLPAGAFATAVIAALGTWEEPGAENQAEQAVCTIDRMN